MLSKFFLLLQQSHFLFRTRVLVREVTVRYRGPHQSPIRIKAKEHSVSQSVSTPLATLWPQKTVGAKACPIVQGTDRVVSPQGQPRAGSCLGRSACLRSQPEDFSWIGQWLIKSDGCEPTPIASSLPQPSGGSGKRFGHLKGDLIP